MCNQLHGVVEAGPPDVPGSAEWFNLVSVTSTTYYHCKKRIVITTAQVVISDLARCVNKKWRTT